MASSDYKTIARLGRLMGRADAALDEVLVEEQPTSVLDEYVLANWSNAYRLLCYKALLASDLYQNFDDRRRSAFHFAWNRGYGKEIGVDPLDFGHDDPKPIE